MARTRDEVPEEEEQEAEEELVSLQFDEPLSWRAGKPIPTGTLLQRLEKLSQELIEMDQDTVDKESLTKVAKELAAHNLLAHKDAGVKAYAASCLVDILKLCAPDAPFTPSQLKEIFGLFAKTILPALWDPTNAYNTQHKYVLTSLAEVKSILLINELTNAEDLLLHLFSSFFDGISGTSKSSSGEQVAKDIEFHMTDILVTLIDEGSTLPPSVLDVIMAQFLRAAPPGGARSKSELNGNQTTLLPKEEPEAYVMAKTVCNTCPDKMARYVSQYFNDVIMESSGSGGHANGHGHKDGESDDEGPTGPSEAEFKELRKAHQLLRELWRASSDVLPNVIPQVDAELSADNVQLRLLATETLGDMIAGIGAAGPPPPPVLDPAAYPPPKLSDEAPEHPELSILTTPMAPRSFAQAHPVAFHNFVNRRNDKSPFIRAAWTTAVGYIISTSGGGIGLSREDEATFITGLRDKLCDSDEKVRLAAVKAIEVFSFRDIVTKLAAVGGVDKEGSILSTLADRCRDKRPPIRVAAMALLGKLWAVSSGELLAGQEVVTSAFSNIPSHILNTFYANDTDLNLLLDRVTFDCLVPLSFPPPKSKGSKSSNGASQSQTQSQAAADSGYDPDRIRAERILLLVRSLNDKAKTAFFALQKRQPQFAKLLDNFVRVCEVYNGGMPERNEETAKQNLKKTIQYLSNFFPDQLKVEADLQNFAGLNDRRCYQLIRFVVGKDNDFKTMHRAIKEFTKRIQGTTKPQILDTMVPLLLRSAFIMFNKSHLSTFIDCSKNDKDGLGAAAQQITTEISQYIPDLFKTHIGQLCKDLMEAAPTATRENDPVIVETLKACSSYSRKYPEELPQDRKFVSALIGYALYGQPPKAAKYAINVMMARKDDKNFISATDLLKRVIEDWGYGSPHFLNKLAAVSQLELLASKVTADHNDEIIDMAIKNVLQEVRTEARPTDPVWASDADIEEECQLKCWALKLVVNRLRGLRDLDEAKELAPTVFKLLRTLIKDHGELCKTKDTPAHHKSRLRLLAGKLSLKLCTHKHFEELFSPQDFNRLALLTQDTSSNVRRLFVEKLQKYLVNNKLRPRFYVIMFLTAHEPAGDFKQQIETWIRSRARYFYENKHTVMEASMARLISLLAHHPDYGTASEDLADLANYFIYYIRNIATKDNFSMIFKYAERVKQTRDGISPDQSERLYVLSDLALAVLRRWQEKKGWSHQVYSGKIGLPMGLYTALPTHDAAQEIANKQFLPDDMDDYLDEILKSIDRKKKRKSMDERAEAHTSPKKAKISAPKVKTSKATKSTGTKKSAAKSKTPAKSKKAAHSLSPPPESADRRRSGRSKKNSTYVERDSSDDDDDMLEGVAEWDYFDEEGNKVQEETDEDESELSEVDEEAEPEVEPEEEPEDDPEAEAEAEPEPMDEDEIGKPTKDASDENELSEAEEDEEEQEKEDTPPPRSSKPNGRKGRRTAAKPAPASKSRSAAPPAIKSMPTRGKPAATSKATSKAKPKVAVSSRVTRGRKAADSHDAGEDSD